MIKVSNARDLGQQFVDNPHRMVGQDGAFSFPLPDGSSFWFFGDTLIGRRPPGSPWVIDGKIVDHRDMTGLGGYERMINNTGLILPHQSGERGLRDYRYILDQRGQLKNLIPLEGEEDPDWDRIWCQGGIAIQDRIVLSFIQVRMVERYNGPLPIGFEIVGSGLAADTSSGVPGEGAFARVRRGGSHILWKADEPHFGVAFLYDQRDGFVYIFGTVNESEGHRAYVARAAPGDVDRPEAYEFFAGAERWSRDPSTGAPLFGGMPSEMSVSFNAYLGAYLAVHSLDLTGKIVARTARHPWGPWSDPVELWQVTPPTRQYPLPYAFPLIYAGKEHPQLSPDGGRTIYLTYIEFEEYFPHLVEVRLG